MLLTPSQRSGSGSQDGLVWPTQGRTVRLVSRPSTRSASVRPARCELATPSPTYPPAETRPPSPCRVTPILGHQSRATPSTPLQTWATGVWATAGSRRNKVAARRAAVRGEVRPPRPRVTRSGRARPGRRWRCDHRRCAGRRRTRGRRHARSPCRPSRCAPMCPGKGFGDDHGAVHGQEPAPVPGEGRREPFGRQHHPGAADIASGGAHPAGLDGQSRRAFVDVHPALLDRSRQALRQLGRVQTGAVGAEHPPNNAGYCQPARHFCGAQLPLILDAQAPPAILSDGRPQPRQLGGRGGEGQRAAQVEVGVDALPITGLDDIGDRVVEVTLERHHAGPAAAGAGGGLAGEPLRLPGMRPDSQPPFRPLAPKPACSASTTAMRSPGSASQRPRRPQAGVAGADHADVNLPRARQAGADRE